MIYKLQTKNVEEHIFSLKYIVIYLFIRFLILKKKIVFHIEFIAAVVLAIRMHRTNIFW